MSKPYKLHKVNSLPSTATEGDIYFVKSDKKIYVRTASGWEDFNGVPVNNLTTTTTGKALDAAQGYALKQAIDAAKIPQMQPAPYIPYEVTYGTAGYVTAPFLGINYRNSGKRDVLTSRGWQQLTDKDLILGPGTQLSPIDYILNPVTSLNMLNYLPAEQIILEVSLDGGSTWKSYREWYNENIANTPLMDSQYKNYKRSLFNNTSTFNISIPTKNNKKSVDCKLRVTFTAMQFNVPDGTPETEIVNYWKSDYVNICERYCRLNKFLINISTSGAPGIRCLHEIRKGNSDIWEECRTSEKMIGWTGWNSFPIGNKNDSISSCTFGGSTSQVNNYWCHRLTFFICGEKEESDDATIESQSSQDYLSIRSSIISILGFGYAYFMAPSYNKTNFPFYSDFLKQTHFLGNIFIQDSNNTIVASIEDNGNLYAKNIYEGNKVASNSLSNKYANKTYNAKSYEAINIKTDNSAESKAANVAAIKAYTDNLISLGVSLNNGFIIPVRVDSINYGVLVGSGSTPRLHGYINRDNTCNSLVIAVDGTAAMSQIQRAAESTLSTTSKTIVGAINELKTEAGMRDNDISAAQSQALSAQEEATDAKNKVTDLEKKIPTIDSALSDTSTNPVQNKILKTCLDNIADNVDAAADAVATLSNKETTIAGQKVKIGGEITAVQLTKGLRFPIRSVLNLLESDQSLSLSSFNAYLTENNLSLQDYFCAPTMIYRSEDDAEPKCGMMYNSPTSHCLTGIFDTGTDTVEFEDIQKIQFNTNSGTINIGNNGLAEVPSATINLSSVPTTSTPVTTTLNDYDYKQMTDLSIKKYVKFPNTMSVNNARTLMELTLMEKSEMIRLSGAEEVWTYVYQHICYYGGGIHVFEFSLNSDTKVLTAKMIM